MAEKSPSQKKSNQISLAEYLKFKEKRAKGKLKLHFPPIVLMMFAVPAVYLIFIVLYFLIYIRFVAQH